MDDAIAAFASYFAVERMRSPSTVGRYVRVLRDFEQFLVDEIEDGLPLEAVDKSTLARFMRRGMEDKDEPSKAVWNARLAALRAFYGYLFRQERISVNPGHRLDRFKIHAKEPVPLSLSEYLELVAAVRASSRAKQRTRNIAIVEIMFHCALRVAEVVSLDVAQVDFENRVFLNVRTKGDKRLSAVFNDIVADAVERYLKDRIADAGELALLISDRGTRLSIRAVQELVKSYAKKAGILRSVTPHLLRHSSATQLVELGTPIRVVQEICGHSSVTTTERYVHVNGGARRIAVDALGTQVLRAKRRRAARRSNTEAEGLDSA